MRLPCDKRLEDGSSLSRIFPSEKDRGKNTRAEVVRAIEYQLEGVPELVRQEFYGFMMAHFAIGGLMHEAVLKADLNPDRVSFVHAARAVRRRLPFVASVPPQERAAFHQRVLDGILEERVVSSRGRRILRGVNRKMRKHPIRRPRDAEQPRRDLSACVKTSEQY